MKGLLILLLSIFALSCDKTQDSGAELDTNTAINLPLEFEQSRISFDDNKYQWQGGESIGLFINTATPATNVEATVDISDGRAYCTTENVEYTPENTLYAYLPYSVTNSNAQSVSLTIPATQSARATFQPTQCLWWQNHSHSLLTKRSFFNLWELCCALISTPLAAMPPSV